MRGRPASAGQDHRFDDWLDTLPAAALDRLDTAVRAAVDDGRDLSAELRRAGLDLGDDLRSELGRRVTALRAAVADRDRWEHVAHHRVRLTDRG